MNIAVIGCGKTGARVASRLDELGFDVSVVDFNKNAFKLLADDFSGICVHGKEFDIEVLRNAGCDNADIGVVTTDSDNINITVARILEIEFGVKYVYVRLLDPSRESVFRKFGLSTVCPTRLESEIFLDLITDSVNEIDSINIADSNISFYMEKCERRYIGQSVKRVLCKKGEMLFAVKRRDGSLLFANEGDFRLLEGDRIIFAKQ